MTANRFVYRPSADFVQAVADLAEQYGVRGLERRFGVNKATVSRVTNGYQFELATAQALGHLTGHCPCCDRRWKRRRA